MNQSNGLIDLPSPETFAELQERVRRRLNGRVRDFRLSRCEDGLILAGRAPSYHAKQVAQHEVMEAIDLPIRANEIEVAEIAGT